MALGYGTAFVEAPSGPRGGLPAPLLVRSGVQHWPATCRSYGSCVGSTIEPRRNSLSLAVCRQGTHEHLPLAQLAVKT